MLRHFNLSPFVAAVLLVACQKQVAPTESSRSSRAAMRCDFTTGAVRGNYCKTPIYALLANPPLYDGKRVFTYGYLVTDGEAFELKPDPRWRRVPDMASCIQISGYGKNDEDAKPLKPLSVYSVALGGTFHVASSHMCGGTLQGVDISDIGLEPEAL